MIPLLPRSALCHHILADPTGTVFLRAPAGAGKSIVMQMVADQIGKTVCRLRHPRIADVQGGWLLWDVPASAQGVRISAQVLEALRHLVIACRPDQRISGLARQILHAGSLTLGAMDLRFTRAELVPLPPEIAAAMTRDYAHWPAFLPLATRPDDAIAIGYLSETFLNDLTPGQITALSVWLEAPSAGQAGNWSGALPPFVLDQPGTHEPLIRLLRRAVDTRMAAFAGTSAITEVATALEVAGRPLAAISLLLDHGHEAHAAQILEHAQGLELIYRSSLEEFRHIVLRFSQEMIATNETVLFAVTRTLMKTGELQRVRHLVAKHLGSDYLDPLKVMARGARFSFAARRFRLNMMIAEDLTPSDSMLTRLGEFMADYPVGDNQKWAAFYNAVLEFEIRRRNFREAEAAAARALLYLRQMGGQPLLEFFIHLHQSVMRLMNGDVLLARRAARDARDRLEQVPHDAVPEFRMLRLVDAALAYEIGHPQGLVDFVQNDFDDFAAAEIWPSLFLFALHYASQALMDHFPAMIRAGFLDGLWIHLSERLPLHVPMEIRSAIAYQNMNRWSEADGILSALLLAKGRNWYETAVEDLALLTRRDEIACAMAWLRRAAHSPSPRPHLERQIAALVGNQKVTLREKVVLRLWLAHIAHQRRDATGARGHLRAGLQDAARLGCHGVLSEERIFVAPLLQDQRIRAHVEASPDIRAALAIYAASINSPRAKARSAGITQRETQMLQLVADGFPNKRIAQVLSISEATVKFHLSNLYTKIGCRNRNEAVRAARALGWL
ncbi:MAG TPA: LuxR C-terminal-related transcriptional regulator [Paenirhodobacter sp.]